MHCPTVGDPINISHLHNSAAWTHFQDQDHCQTEIFCYDKFGLNTAFCLFWWMRNRMGNCGLRPQGQRWRSSRKLPEQAAALLSVISASAELGWRPRQRCRTALSGFEHHTSKILHLETERRLIFSSGAPHHIGVRPAFYISTGDHCRFIAKLMVEIRFHGIHS